MSEDGPIRFSYVICTGFVFCFFFSFPPSLAVPHASPPRHYSLSQHSGSAESSIVDGELLCKTPMGL